MTHQNRRLIQIMRWMLSGLLATSSYCIASSASATPSASEYRQLGLTYRQQEQYPEAIAALQQAVVLDPENLAGRISLGWTQHLAGQGEAAMESLFQVLYRDPFSVPALNALGIVYLVNGHLMSEVMTHTWAATLKPDNEIAYYNLSLGLHRLGQYEWAVVMGNQAAALEPTNPHPPVAVAIAYWDAEQQTLAQEAYRQALALDGRYRDREFLNYLDEAGFSAEQIRTAQAVLAAVGE